MPTHTPPGCSPRLGSYRLPTSHEKVVNVFFKQTKMRKERKLVCGRHFQGLSQEIGLDFKEGR